jgi:hypothetical protein
LTTLDETKVTEAAAVQNETKPAPAELLLLRMKLSRRNLINRRQNRS